MEQNRQTLGKLRNMTAIYLTCGDRILLLYRQGSRVVNNLWVASAGGHFEENELNDACACVLRELQEELNIGEDMLENLALRYITLRRTEKEIRQNYYFYAELRNGTELELHSDEGRLQWFSIDEIKELEMPFSAKFAMEHWLEIGRYNTKIYGGISDGTSVVFTELPAF